MKPIKKRTAKIFIALVIIALVVGTLFAFVPMNFGSYRFTSLVGSINVASDLGSGVYAEYDIDGEFSTDKINKSISTIRSVLQDRGYSGSTIFSVNNKKLRVEIGYPLSSSSLRNSYTLLNAVAVGDFELRSSSSEDDTYILGRDHVTDVEINNYQDSIYVVLNFNKAGEEQYAKLLEATTTIYVCMGGEIMTSFNSSNATASSSMPLSFTDYNSARDFAMRVTLGSMPIKLNKDTVSIDTMETTISRLTKIICAVAISALAVFGICYFVIENGIMGLFALLSLLFSGIIAIGLLCAFEWVELSFSSLIAIGIGVAILLSSMQIFVSRFKEEYKTGKTIGASLETGYKRSVPSILATGIALTVIFGVVAIVAGAELKVFGLITCIFAVLSLFSSLVMFPGFVSIFEAFNDGAIKPYRLKEMEGEKND